MPTILPVFTGIRFQSHLVPFVLRASQKAQQHIAALSFQNVLLGERAANFTAVSRSYTVVQVLIRAHLQSLETYFKSLIKFFLKTNISNNCTVSK